MNDKMAKLNINEFFICKIWKWDNILTPACRNGSAGRHSPSSKRRGEQIRLLFLNPLLTKEGVGVGLG